VYNLSTPEQGYEGSWSEQKLPPTPNRKQLLTIYSVT